LFSCIRRVCKSNDHLLNVIPRRVPTKSPTQLTAWPMGRLRTAWLLPPVRREGLRHPLRPLSNVPGLLASETQMNCSSLLLRSLPSDSDVSFPRQCRPAGNVSVQDSMCVRVCRLSPCRLLSGSCHCASLRPARRLCPWP
jgi:hypothetical protein